MSVVAQWQRGIAGMGLHVHMKGTCRCVQRGTECASMHGTPHPTGVSRGTCHTWCLRTSGVNEAFSMALV
jgi:hypothetical protein